MQSNAGELSMIGVMMASVQLGLKKMLGVWCFVAQSV